MSEARTPEEDTIRPDKSLVPESRADDIEGPTPEEEMRGAQPPGHDPAADSVREHETRETGATADVVDLDDVDETGSLRTAHKPSDGYQGPDPEEDEKGDASDEDQGT